MELFENLIAIKEANNTVSKKITKNNQLNERASIGQIDEIEEKIKDMLGTEEMLEAICRALDYDTKADIYHYIWRMYGLDEEEDDDLLDESKNLKEYNSNINNKDELYNEMLKYTEEPLVSFTDLFNCYSTDDLQDLYDYLSSEYEDYEDLDEATSGIGAGAYTKKAIDILPGKTYYKSIKESTNNLKLANMVNKIRKDKKLSESRKVYLEGLIKNKLKTSHLKEKNKNRNKK